MLDSPRSGLSRLIGRLAPVALVSVGLLAVPFLAASQPAQKVFRETLRGLGYVEGQNITYETRFAEAKFERLPDMAAELVRLRVDILVTQGGAATVAAKQATSTIPIVMSLAAGDAVATGMIASLARPGQNITGLTDESVQLSAKRMELLKEAVPKAARIAVLWNANDQGMTLRYREIEKAARLLQVEVQALGVREPADFDVAFSTMAKQRPDAMFLVADALTNVNRKRFIEFASTQRIPAMYEADLLVRDGGLMSYGPAPRRPSVRPRSTSTASSRARNRRTCRRSNRRRTSSPSISRRRRRSDLRSHPRYCSGRTT